MFLFIRKSIHSGVLSGVPNTLVYLIFFADINKDIVELFCY